MYQAVEHRANLNPKQVVHFTLTGVVIGGTLGILIGHGITAFWRGAESFEYRRQLDNRESAIATLYQLGLNLAQKKGDRQIGNHFYIPNMKSPKIRRCGYAATPRARVRSIVLTERVSSFC